MKFQVKHLYPIQAKLDERIFKNHDTSRKATQVDRILALMVELAELANETRCFKFWSLKGASEKYVMAQEYVDGIHFFLSLGLDLNQPFDELKAHDCDEASLSEVFVKVFSTIVALKDNFNVENYHEAFTWYLSLGKALDLSEGEIENHYLQKNKTNHQRQDENY